MNVISDSARIDALTTVAKAFFDRGACIQYDQLSMDRIWRVTPRRDMFATPEEATAQHTLFLDCSSFVFALYYQAFGYRLKADLTSDMMKLTDIRPFYYAPTGSETAEQKAAVLADFRQCLKPGDLIVFVYKENGHTLMYAGNGMVYHCSVGAPCSYDYDACHDNVYPCGGIKYVEAEMLFTDFDDKVRAHNYLFNPCNTAFCILRPLDEVSSLSDQTLRRLEGLQGLRVETACSHPEGRTAYIGEIITYRLSIKNTGNHPHVAEVLCDGEKQVLHLKPDSQACVTYTMRTEERPRSGRYINPPQLTVNGVLAYAPRVLYGGKRVKSATRAIDAEQAFSDIFTTLVNEQGEVYQLKDGRPNGTNMVPGLFGGFGVITPNINEDRHVRIRKISRSALQYGDIIVYRDTSASKACSAVCTEDILIDGLGREDSDRFIDSLFGKFCFAVLRS